MYVSYTTPESSTILAVEGVLVETEKVSSNLWLVTIAFKIEQEVKMAWKRIRHPFLLFTDQTEVDDALSSDSAGGERGCNN